MLLVRQILYTSEHLDKHSWDSQISEMTSLQNPICITLSKSSHEYDAAESEIPN